MSVVTHCRCVLVFLTESEDSTAMSTYSIDELLHRWKLGRLTPEQAGPEGPRHLLQHIEALTKQVTDHERRLRPSEQRPTAKG